LLSRIAKIAKKMLSRIAKIAKNAIQDSKSCKNLRKNAKIEESFAILGSKTC
jgi:hypothetical protein